MHKIGSLHQSYSVKSIAVWPQRDKDSARVYYKAQILSDCVLGIVSSSAPRISSK